jgi:hypothetical protein
VGRGMTVKSIVLKWKKQHKEGEVDFPSGIYFMECTKVDALAFRRFARKHNISEDEYYIEKGEKWDPMEYSVNFRV